MRSWQREETVPIKALTYDEDDAAYTPDQGSAITITDSEGTEVVTDAAMTENATGDMRYYYTLAADAPLGWWRYRIVSQDGTGASAKYVVTNEGFLVR